MHSLIAVSHAFDGTYPFAADHAHRVWKSRGETTLIRLDAGDRRRLGELTIPRGVHRVVSFGVPVTPACLQAFPDVRELAIAESKIDSTLTAFLGDRGVQLYTLRTEGHWGQSVSEFALALTLGALRRIPQTHHAILSSHDAWDYSPPATGTAAGKRGHQFGDDAAFTCGTLHGKRVRIVGMGNIGARYAAFCHALGAHVAAWDPFAAEPVFHRSHATRIWRLKDLSTDAEIFAPMLPLRDTTRGIIDEAIINALPRGALVVCVTRMQICDSAALRRRVLSDELALAADVFDVEPLPLDDPLLGRSNVVHTPHNAGRTIHANAAFADALLDQFEPVPVRG